MAASAAPCSPTAISTPPRNPPPASKPSITLSYRPSVAHASSTARLSTPAATYLHLKGDPKGGSLSFANCGFRNGRSEGPGLHPQIRIDRSGGNTWEVGLHGCWFDADSTQPSRNIEIVGDSIWGNRIDGCSFKHYSLEPMTPFGPLRGALSTVNGLGWNATDPNVAGDWLGHGEPGLEVLAGDTGQVWKCVTAPGTWVMV